jgi:hypothetical protein
MNLTRIENDIQPPGIDIGRRVVLAGAPQYAVRTRLRSGTDNASMCAGVSP